MGEDRIRRHAPELALLVASVLWGASFLATRIGMESAGPFAFVALRFAAATLVLVLLFSRAARSLVRLDVVAGVVVAAAATAGYATQALALETTGTVRVAFVSALYVPLVPMLQLVLFGRRPTIGVCAGVLLAGLGVAVMSGVAASGLSSTQGDLLSLASAFAIALEVVLLGRFVLQADPVRVAVVTVAATTVFALVLSLAAGEPLPSPTPSLMWIVAGFGAATAYIQFAMSWGQRRVDAGRAAMIYSTEPVFGGLIGWAAGEALGASDLIGGTIIIAGVLVASAPWHRWIAHRRRNPAPSLAHAGQMS